MAQPRPIGGITGVILAGGRGSRMHDQDKGLIRVNNRTLIEQILDQLKPQCESIIINANRNLKSYSDFGYPVISDMLPGYQGPLAGMHSAMIHADSQYLITLPCDALQLPPDYVERMRHDHQSGEDAIVVAHDGERLQPVYALLPTALKHSLFAYLTSGERKIDRWYGQHNLITADFSDAAGFFHNFNRPQDLTAS